MSLILLKRIYNFAENLALEKFFVLASFLVGLLYVLLVPPFQNVDEPQHYYRVLGVLEQSVVQNNNGVVGANLAQKYIDYVEDYNYLIKNIDKKVDLNLYKKRYDENSAVLLCFQTQHYTLLYLICLVWQ